MAAERQQRFSLDLEECIKDGVLVDIPKRYIDFAISEARNYFTTQQDRLLERGKKIYTPQEEDLILKNSTHLIFAPTEDPAKMIQQQTQRELIRQLMYEFVGGRKISESGKPDVFAIVGPAGGGKSTLRTLLEDESTKFNDAHLEEMRGIYRKVYRFCASVNFTKMKEALPDKTFAFREAVRQLGDKDKYALIRSMASGINQASLRLARDIGLPIVLEQMFDIDCTTSVEIANYAKGNFFVIGVTCDPEEQKSRLERRVGNTINPEQLHGIIQRFSNKNSYQYVATLATRSVLVDASTKDYKVLHATDKGKVISADEAALEKFKQRALPEYQTPQAQAPEITLARAR